jgi:hypothetical protein
MEKNHFSPSRPSRPSPAPARPQPLTGGPRLSAPAHASLFSISLLCGAGLSAPFLFARAHPLSAPRTPPVSPSQTNHPPPHICRAPLRAIPSHPARSHPFRARGPLAHFPCSVAPSIELSLPLSRPARAPGSSAAAHRCPPPILRLPWNSPPRLLPQ